MGESEDDSKPHNYNITPPGGGSRYDVTISDYVLPIFGLILFSIPAITVVIPKLGLWQLPSRLFDLLSAHQALVVVLIVLVVPAIGTVLFLYNAGRSGSQDTELDQWPIVERVINKPNNKVQHETLLSEYQTIASEARYRDNLLFRLGYYSFASFAVVVTVYVRVEAIEFQTGIALIGFLSTLMFAIASISYKDSRDPLWERMRVLELHPEFKNDLTGFHTIRTRGERRLYDQLSLSAFIINLQIVFQVLWLLIYLITAYIAVSSLLELPK